MMNPVPYQGVEMFRTLLLPLLVLLLAACSSTPEPPPPVRQSGAFDNFYQQWRGVPYRMGGTSRAGLDCSAFTQLAYSQVLGFTLGSDTMPVATEASITARSSANR